MATASFLDAAVPTRRCSCWTWVSSLDAAAMASSSRRCCSCSGAVLLLLLRRGVPCGGVTTAAAATAALSFFGCGVVPSPGATLLLRALRRSSSGCDAPPPGSATLLLRVGFNMRKVVKGNVTMKLWDLGGQPRFRSMWERYCRAVSAIVYVVDAADQDNINISKRELHDLLSKQSLSGIPLLVIGNKIDKPQVVSKQELTDQMDLKSLTGREVCCYMISCKNSTNIDQVIGWLVKHSRLRSSV